MKPRTWKIGLFALLAAALLASTTAVAFRGHGGHRGMMKHFIGAMIDDALDEAKVTPEQRAAIHAARDRALAAVEEHQKSRSTGIEEALSLFEADRVDERRVQALRQQKEAEMHQVGDAIARAVIDAHDVLTPAQRKIVADYVREKHARHAD